MKAEEKKILNPRIPDASEARKLFDKLYQNDDMRRQIRAHVNGMRDGNVPYPQDALEASGQGYRSNVNTRRAEGLADHSMAPYWSLVMDHPQIATFELIGDVDNAVEHADTLAEVFDQTLALYWPGLVTEMQLKHEEMICHGRGHVHFPNKTDWRWTAILDQSVFVRDNTKAGVDSFREVFITQEWSADEIYSKIRKEKKAKDVGWNVAACKRAIIKAQHEQGEHKAQDWDTIQNHLRNNDISWSATECDTIQIVHGYIKEVSGKISHIIFTRNGETDEKEFLFRAIENYDSFRQIIHTYFFDIGSGQYHGVKGLLTKSWPIIQHETLRDNQLNDVSFIAACQMWKTTDHTNADELEFMNIGPNMIAPPGLEAIQQPNMYHNIQAMLMAQQNNMNTLQNNIGAYNPSDVYTGKQPRTLGELELKQKTNANLSGAAASKYLTTFDGTLTEMERRLRDPNYKPHWPGYEGAMFYQQQLKDRGVPDSIIYGQKIIRSSGSPKMPNGVMRSMSQDKAIQVLPQYPGVNADAVYRDWVASTLGSNFIKRYFPKSKSKQEDLMQKIMVENGSLFAGSMVPSRGSDDHRAHIPMHLAFFKQKIEEMGKIPPQMVSIHNIAGLNNVGQHVAQHITLTQNKPMYKAEFPQWMELFTQLSGMLKSFEMNWQKANAESNQQQQQQDPEIAIKQDEHAADMAGKMADVGAKQLDIEQDRELHAVEMKKRLKEIELLDLQIEQKRQELANPKPQNDQ